MTWLKTWQILLQLLCIRWLRGHVPTLLVADRTRLSFAERCSGRESRTELKTSGWCWHELRITSTMQDVLTVTRKYTHKLCVNINHKVWQNEKNSNKPMLQWQKASSAEPKTICLGASCKSSRQNCMAYLSDKSIRLILWCFWSAEYQLIDWSISLRPRRTYEQELPCAPIMWDFTCRAFVALWLVNTQWGGA